MATSSELPFGQVGPICTEARVEIADLGVNYAALCKARSLRPYPPDEFATQLETFCMRTGIRTRQIGSKVFLLDAQLVVSRSGEGERLGSMGRDKRERV